MRYLLILIIIALCVPIYSAEIVRYVDTGSDAGGDGTTSATSSGDNTHAYQSLNAWEAAEETNLDTANNTHTVHCNRTNGGGADTTKCLISNWVLSATDFITIIGDDFPSDGIYDGSKYVLSLSDTSGNLEINEEFVRVVNFQILVTITPDNSGTGFFVSSGVAAGDIRIDSCIIKGNCAGTGGGTGISIADSSITVNIFNTIVTGFISGGDTSFRGIRIAAGAANIYNCTVYDCYWGVQESTANGVILINCAVFNCTDDISGTVTMTYCATDDDHSGDSATNVQITQSADDWAALVVDAAGGNFAVTDASSELYQAGNGATPKSIFTDDIIGTDRDAVDLDWDISAYELAAAPPPPSGQVIMIQMSVISVIFALIFIRIKNGNKTV